MNYQQLIETLIVLVIVYAIVLTVSYIAYINEKETINAFNNSKNIICYDTLIISKENWKLTNQHLIKNDLSGYINILECKVKE